jgi:shikimate dehydrogenase
MSKRVVLIGHPVAHSLSVQMQQAAFDELGIDARYELVDVTLIELPDRIAALRGDEYLGANVTIPYKERVVPMVDRLTEEAQATGAVNTITREGQRLVGHNTDVPGFKRSLDALVGRQKMPKTAVVMGAGGGARAVVHGLITEGFQRVIVFNRHLHRAEALVRFFGRSAAHMELRAMPWHESVIEAELAKAKVLINSTAMGLGSDESPVPAELLPPELLVLDLVYSPPETRLLRDAKAAGATATMNGQLMLLHQGAAAFELWTGRPAPLDLMRRELEAATGVTTAKEVDRPAEGAEAVAVEPEVEQGPKAAPVAAEAEPVAAETETPAVDDEDPATSEDNDGAVMDERVPAGESG